jgi:hypothetical protein
MSNTTWRTLEILQLLGVFPWTETRLIWDISSRGFHGWITGRCYENSWLLVAEDRKWTLNGRQTLAWAEPACSPFACLLQLDVEVPWDEQSKQTYFQLTAFISRSTVPRSPLADRRFQTWEIGSQITDCQQRTRSSGQWRLVKCVHQEHFTSILGHSPKNLFFFFKFRPWNMFLQNIQ